MINRRAYPPDSKADSGISVRRIARLRQEP